MYGYYIFICFLGAIIFKWTNSDKGLKHQWAFFKHFDFFIIYFLQHVFYNIYDSPHKLHYLC